MGGSAGPHPSPGRLRPEAIGGPGRAGSPRKCDRDQRVLAGEELGSPPVDTRPTPEQAELRRAARQLARELGPTTVADLDDGPRAARLAAAVRDAGWWDLRDRDPDGGGPLATGVEAAIVAGALAERVADVACSGVLLARDLARRAGVLAPEGVAVAFGPDLAGAAVTDGGPTAVAPLAVVDAPDPAGTAYLLVGSGGAFGLASVALASAATASATDLTRRVLTVPAGTPVTPVPGAGPLTPDDLTAWTALGLALSSADLVGVMHGVLEVTVEYAAQRRQFGVPVGSFQAVAHLLAEARCLLEGSQSVAQHAAWAVDALPPDDALEAARVAKAYCSRAAREVCETAIQVHGGIGNTWECIVHVYLRRALLSTQWFGDDGAHLRALAWSRLGSGVPVGLP